jgi:hypothetical protein
LKPAAQELVPGTRVSLTAPAGFAEADRFPGFYDDATGSSIVVTELPTPADQMRASLNAEALASRGMNLKSSQPVRIDGLEADLLGVTQTANGVLYEKWIVVTGDSSVCILITATYPQSLRHKLSEPLRRAVLSAKLNLAASVDPFEGLSFRISETEHLKIQNRFLHGLTLAKSGDARSRSAAEPVVIVSPSHIPVEISNLESFAKKRLAQIAEITELSDVEGRAITVSGMPAYEIVASAKDLKTGILLTVYQVMVVDGNDYYLVVGLVGKSNAPAYISQFRMIAHSLKIIR